MLFAVQVLESVAMFNTDVFVGDGESSFTNAVTEWRRCAASCCEFRLYLDETRVCACPIRLSLQHELLQSARRVKQFLNVITFRVAGLCFQSFSSLLVIVFATVPQVSTQAVCTVRSQNPLRMATHVLVVC
jgi:hypothetical protein